MKRGSLPEGHSKLESPPTSQDNDPESHEASIAQKRRRVMAMDEEQPGKLFVTVPFETLVDEVGFSGSL